MIIEAVLATLVPPLIIAVALVLERLEHALCDPPPSAESTAMMRAEPVTPVHLPAHTTRNHG